LPFPIILDMILPAERLRFDADGQNESARLFVVQIQNGELVPVWPAEFIPEGSGHDVS